MKITNVYADWGYVPEWWARIGSWLVLRCMIWMARLLGARVTVDREDQP